MKRALVMILAAAMTLAFTACGSPDSDGASNSASEGTAQALDEETVSPESTLEEFKPLEIKESGYGISDGYLLYTVIVHNPNETFAVESPSVRITARDENDQIIGTQDQVLSIIYPQQDFAFGSLGFEVDQQPAKVDIEALEPDEANIIPAELLDHPAYVPLEIVGANKSDDSILGEVSNPNDYDIESAVVTVIFKDADGKIIGGDSTFIDTVPAGDKTPFELSVDAESSTDAYDIYANLW